MNARQEAGIVEHHIDQGDLEWLDLRAGVVTCSELDHLVSPNWKVREGQGVETFLDLKLAERWNGGPVTSFGGGAMEQGNLREEMAVPALAFQLGIPIDRLGFVTTSDGRFGCSPDGVIRAGCDLAGGIEGGCEVKCPELWTHMGYLRRGVLPPKYAAQVHGAMAVTGAAYWYFMSFSRVAPPLVVKVARDDATIEVILEAVEAFNARLDSAYERLVEINGGDPARKSK